jgi:hypothetical protein
MQTLITDFNLEDEHGRIPARLLPESRGQIVAGETVLAEDGEGNRCNAHVVGISESGAIAYLAPMPGTWERPQSSAVS